jgi:hypothetical protein
VRALAGAPHDTMHSDPQRVMDAEDCCVDKWIETARLPIANLVDLGSVTATRVTLQPG